MQELGIKPPRATFALDDDSPGLAGAVESGISSFLGGFFQPSEEEKLKARAREARKQPKPQIQRRAEIDRGGGGSWNEPKLVAVRRLEKELFETKNPTVRWVLRLLLGLSSSRGGDCPAYDWSIHPPPPFPFPPHTHSLVRAISDRYMQLIDAKISAGGGENDGDPSTKGVSAQDLLAELRKFLDNDGVKKVLQAEEKAARARKESVGGVSELSELNLDIQDGLVGVVSSESGGGDGVGGDGGGGDGGGGDGGVGGSSSGSNGSGDGSTEDGAVTAKEKASSPLSSPTKISSGTGVPYMRALDEVYGPAAKPIMQSITEAVSGVPKKQKMRMSTQVSVIRVAEQGSLRKGGKVAGVVVSPNKPPSRQMRQRGRKGGGGRKKKEPTPGRQVGDRG